MRSFIKQAGRLRVAQRGGVLVGINNGLAEHANRISQLLKKIGLIFEERRRSGVITGSITGFANRYDQIWARS